jgi:hypothetical protein
MRLRYPRAVRLRFLAPVAVVLALALAPPALAQSSADIESARAAFLKGLDLRDKQHDLAGAAERFKAAYALVPTPRIGYELGKTLRAEGDLVGARAAFVAAVHLPPRAHESAEAKKARSDADAEASDLDQRIPRVLLHIVGTGQIFVDGEPLRHDALAVPRLLNPGRHVVQLQVDGDVKGERTITLREGEQKDVTMSPGVEARVRVTVSPAAPPPPVVETRPAQPYDPFATPVTNRVHSNAGIKAGFFYAASTLAGLGVAPGLIALSYMKSAQSACDSNGSCTSDFDNNKNLAMGFAVATDVLWGAALICFVVAIAYPKTSALSHSELGVSPVPGGGMLSAGGTF